MKNDFTKMFLVFLLTIAVILGAFLGYFRFFVEAQNRNVELVMDYNSLKELAALENYPIDKLLGDVQKQGITSLGVFEQTLADANAIGEVYFASGKGLKNLSSLSPEIRTFINNKRIVDYKTYVYVPDQKVKNRIRDQLEIAFGKDLVSRLGSNIIVVDEVVDVVRTIPIGISNLELAELSKKGFKIIPRIWNDPRYNRKNFDQKIAQLKGFDTVIFDGDEVLGYPHSIPALAKALRKYNIDYGYIEIIRQYGNTGLKKSMQNRVTRVHSVSPDELKKLSLDDVLLRYPRAIRERGVRLIYIRPFFPPQAKGNAVKYNLDYLGKLSKKIQGAGFIIGTASAPLRLSVHKWQLFILSLGVAVGLILLLSFFLSLPDIIKYIIIGLFAFISLVWPTLLWQKWLALIAAICFPGYAVISAFTKEWIIKRNVLTQSVLIVMNVLADTFLGIILIIGLLADSRFMLGTESFMGVKLALMLPILLVIYYFFFKSSKEHPAKKIGRILSTRIPVLYVLGGIGLLGFAAIFLARSQNFVIPVPGIEKWFRNFLEMVLWVRPRTKEFLIGYPALLLGAVYYLKGKKNWLWLILAIGTIAPVSMLNTFCHVHTPLMISVIRSFNGLALGLIVGVILYWLIKQFILKK